MIYRHSTDDNVYDPIIFFNQNSMDSIVDERIKYDREYIVLDRAKILKCIDNHNLILTILTDYEFKELLKQIRELDLINDEVYDHLLNDHSEFFNLVNAESISKVLQKQYNYITKIPNILDLENNGLLDSIIKTIQKNPELVIHQPLVVDYTNQYLTEILKINHFISFEKAELVLSNLKDTIIILKSDIIELLHRISPYLSFITDDKILAVQLQLDNSENTILNIFTVNELKMIIDKEIELKYYVLKALTPETINKLFNDYRDQLINTKLDDIVNSKFQTLKDAMLSTDYKDLVASQVDNYLTTTYNSLMKVAIDTSFARFKDEFINVDIKQQVQDYINNTVIQVQSTDVNLTDRMVQSWIKQYI